MRQWATRRYNVQERLCKDYSSCALGATRTVVDYMFHATKDTLGQSVLTFGPEFHIYTSIHAFARLTASHHTAKVHDVTAKHCAPIDERQAPE